eukprot:scaffold26283_cov108-Cylindrotheca_fusiformis.AAC.2
MISQSGWVGRASCLHGYTELGHKGLLARMRRWADRPLSSIQFEKCYSQSVVPIQTASVWIALSTKRREVAETTSKEQ